MTHNKKYYGMTVTQLAILAGLAITACFVFGAVGWLAMRGKSSPFAPASQNTPVSQTTATPFVLPTLTPTETPTPVPYEMLIPEGWLQFKTGLVELWLPKEFKVGNSQLFSDSANSATRDMILTGATSKSSLYRILVMVSYEPLPGDSFEAYIDNAIAELPAEVRMAERRKVSVNSTEAVRFVFETRRDNVDVNDLMYVFLDGSTIWYVEYVAQINEFYEMLPTFEQSVKTFRIVR